MNNLINIENELVDIRSVYKKTVLDNLVNIKNNPNRTTSYLSKLMDVHTNIIRSSTTLTDDFKLCEIIKKIIIFYSNICHYYDLIGRIIYTYTLKEHKFIVKILKNQHDKNFDMTTLFGGELIYNILFTDCYHLKFYALKQLIKNTIVSNKVFSIIANKFMNGDYLCTEFIRCFNVGGYNLYEIYNSNITTHDELVEKIIKDIGIYKIVLIVLNLINDCNNVKIKDTYVSTMIDKYIIGKVKIDVIYFEKSNTYITKMNKKIVESLDANNVFIINDRYYRFIIESKIKTIYKNTIINKELFKHCITQANYPFDFDISYIDDEIITNIIKHGNNEEILIKIKQKGFNFTTKHLRILLTYSGNEYNPVYNYFINVLKIDFDESILTDVSEPTKGYIQSYLDDNNFENIYEMENITNKELNENCLMKFDIGDINYDVKLNSKIKKIFGISETNVDDDTLYKNFVNYLLQNNLMIANYFVIDKQIAKILNEGIIARINKINEKRKVENTKLIDIKNINLVERYTMTNINQITNIIRLFFL